MSSLPDRREAPRRRLRASGMHPGWACFLAAWGSGMFSAAATAAWVSWMLNRADLIGALFLTGIAIGLFIIAGKQAEKLTERV